MIPKRFASIDRGRGTLRNEPISLSKLLLWSYNSRLGRLLMNVILSRPFVSKLYGWIARRPCSRSRVEAFCAATGIDLGESLRSAGEFGNLRDLLVRDIDLSRRPIDRRPEVCVAPADGRLLVYPAVGKDRIFLVKRLEFSLGSFLRDEALTGFFDGGALAVVRLGLGDYHHFHFPLDAVPAPAKAIAGRYHAVSPYSERWPVPVFAENARVLTLLDATAFGRVAMVEVGAWSIGTIRQSFVPGSRVAKGDRKGWFEPGASIVVLLFPPETMRFDPDLVTSSAAGVESHVRLGERIGRTRS